MKDLKTENVPARKSRPARTFVFRKNNAPRHIPTASQFQRPEIDFSRRWVRIGRTAARIVAALTVEVANDR